MCESQEFRIFWRTMITLLRLGNEFALRGMAQESPIADVESKQTNKSTNPASRADQSTEANPHHRRLIGNLTK